MEYRHRHHIWRSNRQADADKENQKSAVDGKICKTHWCQNHIATPADVVLFKSQMKYVEW